MTCIELKSFQSAMAKPTKEDSRPIGPLHLQGFLKPCEGDLAQVMLSAASHPISSLCKLYCPCRESSVMRAISEKEHSLDPLQRQAAVRQKEALERHRDVRMKNKSSKRTAIKPGVSPDTNLYESGAHQSLNADVKPTGSYLFSLEVNDEEGIVRAFCRNCQSLYPLFDRSLYFGIPRKSNEVPPTFPVRSTCGGHTFEVSLGFDYPEDALDENDLRYVTIVARCLASQEILVVLDEEAE